MALIGQIETMIQEEVQRRVDETLTPMLEYISRTYDITLKQLMLDVASVNTKPISCTCQGLAKRGKRCKNRAKDNGYCHMHQDQIPKKPERRPAAPIVIRDLTDCFDNE
jgi:hypothetical protein